MSGSVEARNWCYVWSSAVNATLLHAADIEGAGVAQVYTQRCNQQRVRGARFEFCKPTDDAHSRTHRLRACLACFGGNDPREERQDWQLSMRKEGAM